MPQYMSLERPYGLTAKQTKLYDELSFCIVKIGIKIVLNSTDYEQFRGTTLAVDIEHDEAGGFVGVGLCCDDGVVYYWSNLAVLMGVPFDSLALIGHNGVSDIEGLKTWGACLEYNQLVHDTMLVGHILDSSLKSYSLKDMAKRELNTIYPSYDEIVGKRGLKTERVTLDKQPLELVAMYNALDVYCTWRLYEQQKSKMSL